MKYLGLLVFLKISIHCTSLVSSLLLLHVNYKAQYLREHLVQEMSQECLTVSPRLLCPPLGWTGDTRLHMHSTRVLWNPQLSSNLHVLYLSSCISVRSCILNMLKLSSPLSVALVIHSVFSTKEIVCRIH